jgi:hypothetical protein
VKVDPKLPPLGYQTGTGAVTVVVRVKPRSLSCAWAAAVVSG